MSMTNNTFAGSYYESNIVNHKILLEGLPLLRRATRTVVLEAAMVGIIIFVPYTPPRRLRMILTYLEGCRQAQNYMY